MSEQQRGYERYLPGEVVRMKVQIRHHPMHLRRVDAVFRQQGREEIGLRAEGEELRTISARADLAGGGLGYQSEAELYVRVQRGTSRGVYELGEIVLETYGGQVFSYEAEHEGLGELGFEVAQEPDEKPALMVTILPRSEET